MRGVARSPGGGRSREDHRWALKIGFHEGPRLAVALNDRQDHFGQTVNIASRVQGLAASPAILATGPVVGHARVGELLRGAGLEPAGRHRSLRGVGDGLMVYEIP
jgi:class 3 adenylate cyclase